MGGFSEKSGVVAAVNFLAQCLLFAPQGVIVAKLSCIASNAMRMK